MSLKKAICTKCHIKNERNYAFEVNAEADVCYCPHCMAQLKPEDAIKAYDSFIQKKLSNAYKNLYVRTLFEDAYRDFAHIIEIDPNVLEARFGRILSLLYLSKLRRSRFADAAILLKEESNLYFKKKSVADDYARFLKKCVRAINEYSANFKKRICVKTYYYDEDCVKLMFAKEQELIDFEKFILNEARYLKEKFEVTHLDELFENLSSEIVEAELNLKTKACDIHGCKYSFENINQYHQVVFSRSEPKAPAKIVKVKERHLYEPEKKRDTISDSVYSDNVVFYNFIKQSSPWMIVTFVIGVIFLVVSLLNASNSLNFINWIICLSSLSGFLFLLTFAIIGYRIMVKRRHLIN